MIEKVKSTIDRFNMFEKGDSVCVALSGGADSVALLHALMSIKDELGITLSAAHFNHNLRGEESDRDEHFVRTLCAGYEIPLSVESADVEDVSRRRGESIELTARNLRYDFLQRTGADKIATAHTATDNAETVLINMTRGTALKGLCGIPAVRMPFVRPLLFCSRGDIEKYCGANNLSFVTDSSNLTDDYTRNKVRHRAVPVLKEINPSFDATVERMCESLSIDEDCLQAQAEKLYLDNVTETSLILPEELHRALAVRMLKLYICDVTGRAADYFHLNEIYSSLGTDRKIELFSGFYAHVNRRNVRLVDTAAVSNMSFDTEMFLSSREYFDDVIKINKLLLKNAVDYDKIIGEPFIRVRAEGDKIKLSGCGFTKSLRKVYNEKKIAPELRDILPVAADDEGIIWVKDIGVSERVAISDKTERVLVFNCKD